MPIRFSVIVPNYNHSTFLRQRIDSILQQTYPDFELIILDDASTDNSREIIEPYRSHEKVKAIHYNSHNSASPFLQWEKGTSFAKNDWIWIAESDDFADPHFLEEAVQSIERNPGVVLFYSDGYIIDEIGENPALPFSVKKNRDFATGKWSNSYFAIGIDEVNECLKFDCTINNASGMVFWKPLIEPGISRFTSFRYYGDWYFILTACFHGNICYSSKRLNYYRKHLHSHLNKKSSIVLARHEYFRILKLLYHEKNVTAKKELLDHFAFHYLNMGVLSDGLKNAVEIFRLYLKEDATLAFKVIWRVLRVKLLPVKPKIKFK